jgi:hypothetical protein
MNWKIIITSYLILIFSTQNTLQVSADPNIKCHNSSECLTLLDQTAKSLVGAHYSYGSAGSNGGFDCSGLMLKTFNKLLGNVSLPRSSQDMYNSLKQNVNLGEAKTGDLVFFNTGHGVSHVGMYWGKDKNGNHIMYHSSSSKGVEFHKLNGDQYWMSRLVGVKRIPLVSSLLTGVGVNNFEQTINVKKPTLIAHKADSQKIFAKIISNKKNLKEKLDKKIIAPYIEEETYFSYENDLYYQDLNNTSGSTGYSIVEADTEYSFENEQFDYATANANYEDSELSYK